MRKPRRKPKAVKVYNTTHAAEVVGVNRKTIVVWARQGKISSPKEDANGWLLWTPDLIKEAKQYAESRNLATAVKQTTS